MSAGGAERPPGVRERKRLSRRARNRSARRECLRSDRQGGRAETLQRVRPLAPDTAPRGGVRGGLGPPSKQVWRGNGGSSPRTKQECTSEAHPAGVRGQVAPEVPSIGKFYPVILNGDLLGAH